MQFTQFGHTGLTVSRMLLGTGTFGKQTDEKEAHRMLDKATEAGINFIDAADVYPPGAEGGGAEIIVGRWLSNKRSGFILGTKGGGKMGPAAWDAGSSRKHLLDAIDASLRRLNTDYVDLYQLHMDDPVTPIDEMVGAMDTIVRSGRGIKPGIGTSASLKRSPGFRKSRASTERQSRRYLSLGCWRNLPSLRSFLAQVGS